MRFRLNPESPSSTRACKEHLLLLSKSSLSYSVSRAPSQPYRSRFDLQLKNFPLQIDHLFLNSMDYYPPPKVEFLQVL